MSQTEAYHLRWGDPTDRSAIVSLLKQEDMGEMIDPTECLIVENENQFLGFARVEEVEGKNYLRPIIISPQGQGKGIGRILITGLQQKWQKLFLVARGDTVGFYQKFGFEVTDWHEIAEIIQQECLQCPRKNTCQPTPMSWLDKNKY